MKHGTRLMLATMFLACGVAQAQVEIVGLDRGADWTVMDEAGSQVGDSQSSVLDGLFSADLVYDDGGYTVRSYHESTVAASGSSLSVAGSFLAEVSLAFAPVTGYVQVGELMIVDFTVSEVSYAALDATLDGGEVWFFDLTANDYSFDHAGPGHFTLNATLVAGHRYLFQVNGGAGANADFYEPVSRAATFSLEVSNTPVDEAASAWGDVKALFR